MGQKVHPLGFRLGITQPHLSQWYASKKYYSKYVLEDHFLRTILPKKYNKAGFEKIKISRKIEGHIEIVINAQKPDILIGKKGENLEAFQKEIKNLLLQKAQSRALPLWGSSDFGKSKSRASKQQPSLPEPNKLKVILYVIRCKNNASSIADFLIENLEKRVPYKLVFVLLKKHLKKQSAIGQGMKIQISGRLNGAEIARQEWIREGRLPLQTLQANIDYSFKQAYTIYGMLGVKVWIFKNNATTKTYKI